MPKEVISMLDINHDRIPNSIFQSTRFQMQIEGNFLTSHTFVNRIFFEITDE
jgi:hypothetical protein